jgi:hypothetical protein
MSSVTYMVPPAETWTAFTVWPGVVVKYSGELATT